MPTPDPNTTSRYLTDLRLRIDTLRTQFYHVESSFCQVFDRAAATSVHNGFEELQLLRQLLMRYVQRRTDPKLLIGLTDQQSSTPTSAKQLNSWLSKMATHEDDEQVGDCFSVWQETSKAFLSYIQREADFVNGVPKNEDVISKKANERIILSPKANR